VLSSNEGKCGPLVKRGSRDLYLYGTNTITGGIVVEEGVLWTGGDRVVPVGTPLTVKAGAKIDLYNMKSDFVISSFTGSGTLTNGNVTVTNAVRATCADVFENHGATFAKNLTFAEGAVFEIIDAENLNSYRGRNSTIAVSTVNGTINRLPELKFTKSNGEPLANDGTWLLNISQDSKSLTFRRTTGLVIVFQ